MRCSILLALCAIAVFAAVGTEAKAHPHYTFCVGGMVPLPQVAPADVLDVYYYEAPVFEAEFGNLFGDAHGYHTAFAFKNRHTGINYTVEYDAYSEVLNATWPWVIPDGDSYRLEWLNAGKICVLNTVNDTYYSTERVLVGNITGEQFNAFINWTTKDNVTHGTYQLWDVYAEYEEDYFNQKMWFPSSTCCDFNWRGFQELCRLGADLQYNLPLKHDFINLYTEKPIKVNPKDPETWKSIVSFYKTFQGCQDVTCFLTRFVTDFFGENKYLYLYGEYYLVKPKLFPTPFALRYDYDPLPNPQTKPACAWYLGHQ